LKTRHCQCMKMWNRYPAVSNPRGCPWEVFKAIEFGRSRLKVLTIRQILTKLPFGKTVNMYFILITCIYSLLKQVNKLIYPYPVPSRYCTSESSYVRHMKYLIPLENIIAWLQIYDNLGPQYFIAQLIIMIGQ